MKNSSQKIGIIGFGNMMGAFLSQPTTQKTLGRKDVLISQHNVKTDAEIKKKYGFQFAKLETVCHTSDIWFLGVKPQQMTDVLNSCKKFYTNQIIWTMAAGLETKFYRKHLGKSCPVLRFMPNMPTRLGLGTTAFYSTTNIKTAHKKFFANLFAPTGLIQEIPNEKWLHTIVALSGSGPAFVYEFVQSLSLAAQKLGLPKDIAERFAKQTALGAAAQLSQSNLSFAEQIQKVVSKKGTTEAGLKTLKEHQFSSIVGKCLKAAKHRSQELSANR